MHLHWKGVFALVEYRYLGGYVVPIRKWVCAYMVNIIRPSAPQD
jgi:hypothetical protein